MTIANFKKGGTPVPSQFNEANAVIWEVTVTRSFKCKEHYTIMYKYSNTRPALNVSSCDVFNIKIVQNK